MLLDDLTRATLTLYPASPNGTSTTNTYDTAGRLEQILNAAGAEALSTFLYTLDDRGNRTDAAETLTTPSGMLMSASMPTETPAPTPTPDLTVTPTETQAPTATEAPTVTPTPTEAATVEPLNPTVEPLNPTVEPLNPTIEPLDATVEPLDATVTPAETPMEAPTLAPSETPTPEVTPTANEPPTPTPTPAETPASLLTLLAAEGEHNWHYGYDNLSRVTYACSDWTGSACEGDEFNYSYDGGGNLLRFDKWNASTSQVETVRYVINGANQITCVDADASTTCNGSETVWVYDKYGNLLSDGTSTYVYDAANRLSSVTNATGTTTYAYSGDGDRISQTVDSVTTTYVLDTATPLTMVLSETTGTTTIRYWHGLDLIAQSDGTTITYLNYDGLGSVRQLTDTAGSVQLAQTFDPYGTLYSDAGTNSTKFAYTGEYQDSNGLLYLRARYYNAGMGRFTQMDPSRQEKNAYQYAASNPVMFVDPFGLCGRSPDDTQETARCEQVVKQLEANYHIAVYWPSRILPAKLNDIVQGQTCYCDAVGNPCPKPAQYSQYKEWRYREIYALALAIAMYEYELGPDAVTAFLSQVAFVRAKTDLDATAGLLGRYWRETDQYPGFGGRPVIMLSDLGAGEQSYVYPETGARVTQRSSETTWTLTHEIAHRVDKYAAQIDLYNALTHWRADKRTGPTDYARREGSSTSEDVAESITWYLWQRQSGKFVIKRSTLWGLNRWDERILDENPLLPTPASSLKDGREDVVKALFDAYRSKWSKVYPRYPYIPTKPGVW